MKKILMFAMASLLFSASVMAGTVNGGMSDSQNDLATGKRKKSVSTPPDEMQRTFHVTRIQNDENRFVLMIGRKPNTKVSVSVFDKNGNLLYKSSRKANRDFATILNLENIEGALIKVSDTNGLEKDFSF
jgi:hypothetical protein